MKTAFYVESYGRQVEEKALIAKIKEIWVAEGNKIKDIKDLNIMQNLKMTPATILLTATFQVISNCMNNGSITQHVIANRFLHTNSKEASGSIDAKASLSLSEFYDLYKDSNIRHSAKIPLCLFLDHLRRILAIQFKPERNAVLTVVNAVWLSQLLHGCLDNGKADTAAAVLPCSRFIHLVEFIPEF